MVLLSMERCVVDSPLGCIAIEGTERGVHTVQFCESAGDSASTLPALRACAAQLTEYFAGKRKGFDALTLALAGSEFQLKVWQAAMNIPYGTVQTYGDIAQTIGSPRAARAVGSALRKNPLLLLVPCHRIVPMSGNRVRCGQFAAGSWRKVWLLDHEDLQNKKTV